MRNRRKIANIIIATWFSLQKKGIVLIYFTCVQALTWEGTKINKNYLHLFNKRWCLLNQVYLMNWMESTLPCGFRFKFIKRRLKKASFLLVHFEKIQKEKQQVERINYLRKCYVKKTISSILLVHRSPIVTEMTFDMVFVMERGVE